MKNHLMYSIEKSLDWIHANLGFFELPEYNLEEEQFIDMPRKRLGELSLSLIILARNKKLSADKRVLDILKFVEAQVHLPYYNFNMARNLSLFPFYLMMSNGLSSFGIKLPKHHFVLQQISDAGYVNEIERTNWSKIDFRYYLDLAGISHQMPSYDHLYQYSSLKQLPAFPYLRDIDAYAITHIIFHMSDFGKKNPKEIFKTDYKKITSFLEFLTGYYTHKTDWDLVAELLMCCHNLKYRNFPLFKICWNAFLGSQNKEGDFTSRYIQEDLKAGKPITQKDRFNANYHPTLVGLFASVLELSYLEDGK